HVSVSDRSRGRGGLLSERGSEQLEVLLALPICDPVVRTRQLVPAHREVRGYELLPEEPADGRLPIELVECLMDRCRELLEVLVVLSGDPGLRCPAGPLGAERQRPGRDWPGTRERGTPGAATPSRRPSRARAPSGPPGPTRCSWGCTCAD